MPSSPRLAAFRPQRVPEGLQAAERNVAERQRAAPYSFHVFPILSRYPRIRGRPSGCARASGGAVGARRARQVRHDFNLTERLHDDVHDAGRTSGAEGRIGRSAPDPSRATALDGDDDEQVGFASDGRLEDLARFFGRSPRSAFERPSARTADRNFSRSAAFFCRNRRQPVAPKARSV